MDLYYINSLSIPTEYTTGERPLDEFINVYTQTMGNTLKALKIYQEFLRTNNEMVEKITSNFVEMFEKNNMNTNIGFMLGVITGYQKAKGEEKLATDPSKEPSKHFM